ncbi:helix-turn-helix transcriptional regulator [Proteobacteria bacterium 005FR1]|nr:helix-turn-helix transcriptional regulator [Proteobacteria bacterium 005FR1]
MKDHIFNIHDVILLMTVAECILLALFQAVLPVKNRLYSRLLATFLLTIATGAASTLVLWNIEVSISPTFDRNLLPYFLMVSLMLKGPVLLLYVLSITQHEFRLRAGHLIHLLPSLFSVVLMLVFGVHTEDLLLISPTQVAGTVVSWLWDLAKLIPLLYAAASVVLVQRYRNQLKDEYSHFSTTEPSWLNVLTLGFFSSWTWTVIVHVIAKFSTAETADILGIVDNYITFTLINALFVYSLAYAHKLLMTRAEPPRDSSDSRPTEQAIDRVKRIVEEDRIYLEQNLNIEQFSARLGMPVKEVSAVINKHFGTNFFEYINSYRVNEAKLLLADKNMEHKTILDILLESGFNSKSAFHRFFRRLVGMSPTEFRKQALAESEN